ncbi:hypothetical protein PtrSN002B_002800 [Pyrenophora tritici-repentis]|uniref:Uncharacterized protein n=2 Tax=Pyrenophora tritici-repentis TaxID=45151 RepID=A0A2W1DYT0_9PLEO|nr:uncharacterized protein PTRG_03904 [Pyrenophora tritici-repentis Pt-1C-BFP]KAA8620037.1 hypothetical protein PtrV1_07131 [Pyrenophora tritici-repentis]EDU46742.1 predicted protein [Pyrenophora tritici-repentis Pt-1C-BFP]KAF7448191.1 hypothetical protein A1F99_075550 [Pyrenophora tritici-repentis]KAG9384907.1 hypothetical protein A1F94_004454 [Pyrenophora tritici-repentis]KAI0584529.1 hypothetical protein Alg215_03008 [Pyrenophora tritici-repentis]
MARHRRGRSVDTDDKNLYPLLRVLKAEFGIDWGVYQEFLDSAKAAIKAGESYSAWTAQIELLIQTPTARMAHEGVLLLLKEMGVKAFSQNNTNTETNITTKNMTSALPTPNSTPPPPRPTVPVAAHMHTNGRVAMPPPAVKTPTRTTPTYRKVEPANKNDHVFFSDPVFKLDVQNFFGVSSPSNNIIYDGTQFRRTQSQRVLAQPRSAPPYKAADDDLAVWKKRLEVEHGVKGSQAQGNTKDLKTTEDLQRDKSLGDLRRSG